MKSVEFPSKWKLIGKEAMAKKIPHHAKIIFNSNNSNSSSQTTDTASNILAP